MTSKGTIKGIHNRLISSTVFPDTETARMISGYDRANRSSGSIKVIPFLMIRKKHTAYTKADGNPSQIAISTKFLILGIPFTLADNLAILAA